MGLDTSSAICYSIWLPIRVPQQQPVVVVDQLRWPYQHFPEAEGTNSLCAAGEAEQQPRHHVTLLHIHLHLLPVLWQGLFNISPCFSGFVRFHAPSSVTYSVLA